MVKYKDKTVRPDAKGRITLGKLAEGVSSYIVTKDSHNRLILEPQIEIPASEKWLFESASAFNKVKQGLTESATGKVKSKGSFSKYAAKKDKK